MQPLRPRQSRAPPLGMTTPNPFVICRHPAIAVLKSPSVINHREDVEVISFVGRLGTGPIGDDDMVLDLLATPSSSSLACAAADDDDDDGRRIVPALREGPSPDASRRIASTTLQSLCASASFATFATTTPLSTTPLSTTRASYRVMRPPDAPPIAPMIDLVHLVVDVDIDNDVNDDEDNARYDDGDHVLRAIVNRTASQHGIDDIARDVEEEYDDEDDIPLFVARRRNVVVTILEGGTAARWTILLLLPP